MLDVAIVGAGSAGLAALREVRKRTDNYVLINDGPYGTTCARVGCMPSKVLIEAANAFHRRHAFPAFGISGGDALSVDVPAVLRRVRALRDDFVAGTLKAIADLGERNIAGRARLLGPDRLAVDGREIRARRIILATGSRPVVPDPWRELGDRLLTTDTLFEQATLPRRLAVVGLGPIGLEMAQALVRLGLEVHGFDVAERIGGLTDPVVHNTLVTLLGQEVPLHLGRPAELATEGDGVRVANGAVAMVVDKVLVALGRRPNIDGLGLETLGVPLDRRGLPPVNVQTTQIADLPVFLAGDANGFAPLLHEAADEGHIAGLNALRGDPACFQRRTPLAIIFCDPNVATVGRRFSDLDQATVVTGQVRFDRQGRARTAENNRGTLRVYADRSSGALLGAEICAPAGEHLAHLLALALSRSLTVQDLLGMPFYHPVLEEGLRTALRALSAALPGRPASDLAACSAYGIEALD